MTLDEILLEIKAPKNLPRLRANLDATAKEAFANENFKSLMIENAKQSLIELTPLIPQTLFNPDHAINEIFLLLLTTSSTMFELGRYVGERLHSNAAVDEILRNLESQSPGGV